MNVNTGIFRKIHWKTPVPELFFLTKLDSINCNFIKKEILIPVLFCEFCEIFKNIFFIEHLRAIATVMSLLSTLIIKYCCSERTLFD